MENKYLFFLLMTVSASLLATECTADPIPVSLEPDDLVEANIYSVPEEPSETQNPVPEEDLETDVSENEDSDEAFEGAVDDSPSKNPEQSLDSNDLETADNIVFRPVFRYRKQSVEKRKVFRDRNGNLTPAMPAEAASVLPAPARNPPPLLVYDRASGAYYPLTNYNPYYSGNPEAYPAYYRNVRRN